MMRPSADLPRLYLCREPVDFRKGMQSLAVLVEQSLGLDPFAETLYVFTNRRRDAVKCLYWERNGFCLWHKRLEQERFKWPRHLGGEVITLCGQELNWLLDGYDLRHLTPHEALNYKTVL
jgi:transposase